MAMTPQGVELPRNTAFSSDVPYLQLGWDSTSAKALITCPRLYFYTIVQGWTPRTMSVHLQFGLWYHEALERYHHHRAAGQEHESALREVVRHLMGVTWNPTLRRPWISDIPEKTRYTLVRTVVWYLDQFGANDPFETILLHDGKPAVELSFRYETDYSSWTGEAFLVCGHIDRMIRWQDDIWVSDYKTTKGALDDRYFHSFSPHFQFSNYTFAAKVFYHEPVKGIILDAAQVGVTFSRFFRTPVPRDDDQLAEFYDDWGDIFERAQRYAGAGRWPMNPEACGNYGGCAFREICSKSPKVRDQWLHSTFRRRVWDPLQVRGDI